MLDSANAKCNDYPKIRMYQRTRVGIDLLECIGCHGVRDCTRLGEKYNTQ